jgi:hypothetical protein
MFPSKKIPIQILKAKYSMIIKWLVNAIPKGNKLNKFNIKTKKNIEKNKIIYLNPIEPNCCLIKLKINFNLYQLKFDKLQLVSMKKKIRIL